MKAKRVLVTGGAGSIGSEIVKKALTYGAEEVVVFDTSEIGLYELGKVVNNGNLRCLLVDVRDSTSVERAFSKIGKMDIVFHAAAMKHVVVCEENPIEAALTNIIGTQNVVDAAVRWDASTIVLVSTDKAVEPLNVMGATKFMAEKIFLGAAGGSADKNFSVVRFGNVANSRGSVIPTLTQSMLRSNEIAITNPDVTRFVMRVEDAVALAFRSLEISTGGEIFVLKMPSFRLGDLADTMVNSVAPHLGIEPDKIRVRSTGLVKGEKMHEKLLWKDELGRVVDLGDFYVIIDPRTFPKHKKFLIHNSPKDVVVSSEEAPRISPADLRDLVFDFLSSKMPSVDLLVS